MAVATVPRQAIPTWARDWVLERGILYAMTQTPLLAVIGGVFYRLMPYPFMLLPLIASFVIMPIWVSYRRRVSTNPDEPVHHLHKYALWALIPAAMFTIGRIPLFYLSGIVYWNPWYDFGSALTGAPLWRVDTLFVGGVLNALQGWAMGMGFYILFKRHSLINVLLYVAVWISSLYSYDFAAYSRMGAPSPPFWHAGMAFGHFSMSLGLWFMPQFYKLGWPRLNTALRAATVGVGALIVATPSGFAQWQASAWEAPLETRIDQAAFSRPNLVSMKSGPSLLSADTDARYRFTLQFGPREYRNWWKELRAVDARSVRVTGRLWRDGQIIAWCDTSVESLPSPNGIVRPADFPAAMNATTSTEIPVSCTGPAAAATGMDGSSRVTVQWTAQMTLIGGRVHESKLFNGDQTTFMSFSSQTPATRTLATRAP